MDAHWEEDVLNNNTKFWKYVMIEMQNIKTLQYVLLNGLHTNILLYTVFIFHRGMC